MGRTEQRGTLLGAEVFLGLSAVAGMVGLLSGELRYPARWLQGTPFPDYTVPALCLGVLVGGTSLAAALALVRHSFLAGVLSVASGVSIIVFELVEMSVTRYDPAGLPLQLFYTAVGLLILGLTGLLWRSAHPHGPPLGA